MRVVNKGCESYGGAVAHVNNPIRLRGAGMRAWLARCRRIGRSINWAPYVGPVCCMHFEGYVIWQGKAESLVGFLIPG